MNPSRLSLGNLIQRVGFQADVGQILSCHFPCGLMSHDLSELSFKNISSLYLEMLKEIRIHE
jgi:hypothetical protein